MFHIYETLINIFENIENFLLFFDDYIIFDFLIIQYHIG